MGHEDQFTPSSLGDRCRFSQGTLARTHGNGRDAPKADLPGLAERAFEAARTRIPAGYFAIGIEHIDGVISHRIDKQTDSGRVR